MHKIVKIQKENRFIVVIFLLIIGIGLFDYLFEHLLELRSAPMRLLIMLSLSLTICFVLKKELKIWFNQTWRQEDSLVHEQTQKMRSFEQEMRKQIYDLHNLFEISITLTSILDYEQLVKTYLLSLIGQMKVNGAIILFPEEDNRQLLKPFYYKGISRKIVNQLEIKYDDELIRYFHQKYAPVTLSELRRDGVVNRSWHQLREAKLDLMAPILYQDKTQGIIALGEKIDKKSFTPKDKEIFSLMVNIGSVAISNAKHYHKMELISVTDELTGLYNYRFFKKQLNDEIARASRFKHLLSLVIIDVDHFKNYNDTLGHLAGDEVLRQMGKLLIKNARQSDIVSRYGGEEFCVILPEVDLKGAWFFSERLRKQVENFTFYRREIQPLGKITISIGAACFPDNATQMNDLIEKADSALYQAKGSGRNRICLYCDNS